MLKEFTTQDLHDVVHVVGMVYNGKTDEERSLGFAMWRAVQSRDPFAVRTVLMSYWWGRDRLPFKFQLGGG